MEEKRLPLYEYGPDAYPGPEADENVTGFL
jgi:hypothetical protein